MWLLGPSRPPGSHDGRRPTTRCHHPRGFGRYRHGVLDQATRPDDDVDSVSDKEAKRVPVGLIAAMAGAIVGAGVVAVLVMGGVFDRDDPQPNAQDELVAAYERSRNAVYALEGEFSRTLPDGRRLESGALVVQQPPNQLRRQLGGTSGRMNGRELNCSTAPNGRMQCATGAEVGPWDEMVSNEVANLHSYFDPDRPAYTVEAVSDQCFELTLTAVVADPPYGRRAVMCFDPTTGGMRSIEVEHEGGAIDRLEAVVMRGNVTDADFALDDEETFASREEAG